VTFRWPPLAEEAKSDTSYDAEKARRSSIAHNINLIDTPGHADFTFEVLRSLRVLDGYVCILDGVAGVEAQTEQVWRQADHHNIPRIIFINKMDRDGASFAKTVCDVASRLQVWPAVCQIPWWEKDGSFRGIGDVISLRGLAYSVGGDGKQVDMYDLIRLDQEAPDLSAELKKARVALVELLSEHDDDMVEHYLNNDENHLAISEVAIVNSLRKLTLQVPQLITPVFAGASFKNIGVQPLLDAVVDLLPSPDERSMVEASLNGATINLDQFLASSAIKGNIDKQKTQLASKNIEACALAFKVTNDAKRGVLVYFRVYSGIITRNSLLYNTNLNLSERAQRLFQMQANDAIEVDHVSAGQIGVIPGLKHARTGDTLISYKGMNPKVGPPFPINTLQLKPITVPPPVFFASVEPNSLSDEKNMHEKLAILLREDPSLHVSQDQDTGQIHLSGMGELHLEIASDRLVNELSTKVRIGNIQIGYRESISSSPEHPLEHFYERDIAGKAVKAGCAVHVSPLSSPHSITQDPVHFSETISLQDSNCLTINISPPSDSQTPLSQDSLPLPDHLLPVSTFKNAVTAGVSASLSRGPSFGFPLHSLHVTVNVDTSRHIFGTSSTGACISSCVRDATTKFLRETVKSTSSSSNDTSGGNNAVILEPVMLVSISTPERCLGSVVHDLNASRGGIIESLDDHDDNNSNVSEKQEGHVKVNLNRVYYPPDPFSASDYKKKDGDENENRTRRIVARVPLKEMVGYLKHLRSLTGGRGTFVMTVDKFEKMNAQRMKVVILGLRGGFM